MKTTYGAYVANDQGASESITSGQTSIRACEEYARRNYGKGWTVHIVREEPDAREVKVFRLTK